MLWCGHPSKTGAGNRPQPQCVYNMKMLTIISAFILFASNFIVYANIENCLNLSNSNDCLYINGIKQSYFQREFAILDDLKNKYILKSQLQELTIDQKDQKVASAIVSNCLEPKNDLPLFSGKIVYIEESQGRWLKSIDGITGEITEINKDVNLFFSNVLVSPDHKLLIYIEMNPQKIGQSKIIVSDSKIKKINEINWKSNWINIADFHDNEWLLINKSGRNGISQFLLNIFSGEEKDISQVEFPNIRDQLPNLYFWGNHNISQVVYDQSLTRAVYPSNGDGSPIVLWNIEKNEEISHYKTNNGYSFAPLWVDNGSKFFIGLAPISENQSNKSITEIFSIDRDGKIEKISEFSKYFNDLEITAAILSPNMKYLSLLSNSEEYSDQEISGFPGRYTSVMSVDLSTKNIIDYCIPSDNPFSPVWSPDSNQIAFSYNIDNENSYIFIIDIKNSTAYKILEQRQKIVGWLQ
jgi:hypothetical protein